MMAFAFTSFDVGWLLDHIEQKAKHYLAELEGIELTELPDGFTGDYVDPHHVLGNNIALELMAAQALLDIIPELRTTTDPSRREQLIFLAGSFSGELEALRGFREIKTMHAVRSVVVSVERANHSAKKKDSCRDAASEAIQWMLKRWSKGEEADHSTFARYVYYEKPNFGLKDKKISFPKFLALVKEAAYLHYPQKVRGAKKPLAL